MRIKEERQKPKEGEGEKRGESERMNTEKRGIWK